MFLWEVIETHPELYQNTHEYWNGKHQPSINDFMEVFQKDMEKIIAENFDNNSAMLDAVDKIAHRTYTRQDEIISQVYNPFQYSFGNLIVSCCHQYIYKYESDFKSFCDILKSKPDNREFSICDIWYDYSKLTDFLENKISNEALDVIKRYPSFLKQFCENGRGGFEKIEFSIDSKKVMFQGAKNPFSCHAFTYTEDKKRKVVSAPQEAIFQLLLAHDIPCRQEYGIECNGHKRRFDIAVYNDKGLAYFIEYDSEIHYKPIDIFGGEEKYLQRVDADKDKNQWCKEHNIPLIRIPYTLNNLSINDCKLETSKYVIK